MTVPEYMRDLLAVNRAITSELSHGEVLRLVVEKTAALFESTACVLLLSGPDRRARVVASAGVGGAGLDTFSAPLDENINAAVRGLLAIQQEDMFLGVPVVIRGRVEGVLAVFRRGAAAEPDDELILSALADQAAIALDNAERFEALRETLRAREQAEAALSRAHEAEQRMRRQLEDLARAQGLITERIADVSRTGITAVLQTIIEQAQLLTDAEQAALGIGDDPEQPFEVWVYSGLAPELVTALGPNPKPIGVLGVVPRTGRALRLRDLREHPDFGGVPSRHPPMTSFLGVPLRHRGKTMGTVYLGNKRGAAEFTEEDQQVIEMLATRVSVILEVARLSEAEATQRAWLQAVIDQMPDGVLVADATGHLTINQAARALSPGDAGSAGSPGLALPFIARLPSGQPARLDELLLQRALAGGEAVTSLELTLHCARGAVPVLASVVPVRLGETVRGAVAVLRNIELQKQIERLREQWTSLIAHDLRQPLYSITLAARLLAGLPGDGRAPAEEKAIARIQTAAARLERMVSDILDMTRIETHQMKIERAKVDLTVLVEELVERLAPQLAGHPVEVEIAGSPCPVEADAGRLDQILVNLLTNAVKYGLSGTPITIGLCFTNPERVEVSVTNRGKGIDREDLPRVFDRFYRTRDAAEGSAEGLGVGLNIVRGLVAAHGGEIWAESTPGETTTFRFTLPCQEAAGGGGD